MPGGVDHADGDGLFVGVEACKVGLGPDGGKGLAVDRGAVGFVSMRHQAAQPVGRAASGVQAPEARRDRRRGRCGSGRTPRPWRSGSGRRRAGQRAALGAARHMQHVAGRDKRRQRCAPARRVSASPLAAGGRAGAGTQRAGAGRRDRGSGPAAGAGADALDQDHPPRRQAQQAPGATGAAACPGSICPNSSAARMPCG